MVDIKEIRISNSSHKTDFMGENYPFFINMPKILSIVNV